MSVGKSSIARAASAKASATAKKQEAAVFMTVEAALIQPLAKTDEGDIAQLLKSVKARGVLVPLLLATAPDGKFWMIDGARRLAAAKVAGKEQLPAMVIAVENKREASALARELQSLCAKSDNIHEEKFKAIERTSRDMPYYLL